MSPRSIPRVGFATILGLALHATAATGPRTISLTPVADTSIYSAFPTFNFGGGPTFTAGGRPKGGSSRGLLLFDVADSIPAGATIETVSLRVTVVGTPPSGSVNSVFDLNRLTKSWGEGTGADRGGSAAKANQATWVNPEGTGGSPWATPGGDFSSPASDSTPIASDGNYTFASNPRMVADVQSWLDDRADNFGWIMRSESESIARTIRRFGSRANSSSPPLLTVHYTVPEPTTGCLLTLALAVFAVTRCRSWSARKWK
jgi:hypothetical protein